MALIGNINTLQHIFYKTEELQSLYDYLEKSSNPASLEYQRIMQTQGENKISLKYDMFAIEQSYCLKEFSNVMYETHIEYVDFQLVVEGEEFFAIGNKNDFKIKEEKKDRDLIVYENSPFVSKIYMRKNSLAVFFDYDVHGGGLALENLDTQTKVYKTVVKVPKKLLKLKL